jgi:ferritin-like metal-binding protein YciE
MKPNIMATKEKTRRKPGSAKTAVREMPSGQTDLMELLVSGIRDIYWAENHLVKALPKMKSASGSKDLQKAIADHLEITKGHVTRLEQIFEMLGQKPLARKCDAMEGLTLEGEGTIEDTVEGTSARDLGINLSCQKVEHYEMATYMGLANLAVALGYPQVADLLHETLREEEESAELLSELSEDITGRAGSEN